MRIQSVVFAALLAGVSSVAQSQDGIASPRDAASGLPSVIVRASNSSVVILQDVLVSSLTVVSRNASGRRQHKPLGWRITLPPGAAPTNFSFGASNPTTLNDNVEIVGVVLQLALKGANCAAAAPARFDAQAKQLMIQLGDVAAFFDTQGKAIAAKCNAQ